MDYGNSPLFFHPTMPKKYSLFIGRWQPLHKGHKKLINTVLERGEGVLIAIRDTAIDEHNPYTIKEREEMFRKEYGDKVKIIAIPDIKAICFGRNVGYEIRKIEVDKKIEMVSGTEIRNYKPKILWLTGNSGAGKTTLAFMLRDELRARMKNVVVLDGGEMRASISLGAGFSKKDRRSHNLRVARLAKVLNAQGCNVIVAVIAPFEKVRKEIETIIKPVWIYIYNPQVVWGKDRPYEIPEKPNLIIDSSKSNVSQEAEKIIRYLAFH